MKKLDSNIPCPSCQVPLTPRVLWCEPCDLKVEGSFRSANEFAALDKDLLHFMRVFVHCEGRIKDMEAALGVSYPTVKAQLSRLKDALQTSQVEQQLTATSVAPSQKEVLAAMNKGELTFEEALLKIKNRNQKKK